MAIKNTIKKSNFLYNLFIRIMNKIAKAKHIFLSDERQIKRKWKKIFGYPLNLNNPVTINEKIQWLKLHDRKDIYTVWADKYKCREYIRHSFGEDYLIPLLLATDNPLDVNPSMISEFPCIVKANHTSGNYQIIRSKEDVNWKHLRRNCNTWLKENYYYISQEWQYKDIKPLIIVEKLLLDKNSKIPNDFKLHFIEGELQFIYCSVDREGKNFRQIYDKNWNILNFSWDSSGKTLKQYDPIEKPKTLEKMIEIGKAIAKEMHYVRVDFYDVDGKLFCGEITLYHGGGMDVFNPKEFDLYYGNKIKLP